MALSSFEKIRIIKFLKDTPLGEIYYNDMCCVLERGRKASYSELIEFFTKYVTDGFNNNSFSKNVLIKCISCINTLLGWIDNADEVLVGKIRLIKVAYEDYLQRNNLEAIEDLEVGISSLDDYLRKNYPINNEEQIISYIKEINALQEQIKELKRNLTDQIGICEALNRKNKDLEKSMAQKIEDNNQIKAEAIQEAKVLKAQISALKEEISNLQSELAKLQETLLKKEESLKFYADKERKESLLEIKMAEDEEKKQEILKIILTKLTSGGLVLEELLNELISSGYDVSIEQLFSYINEFKKEINIGTSMVGSKPKYIIVPPSIESNGVFDISVSSDCKCYDILLISDLHLGTVDEKIIRDYNKVLDYCTVNNIRLILNVGDFFCFKYPFKTEMLKGLTGSKKIVDKVISKLPVSPGIYHAVLGGNHDKDALGYGIDSIKRLSDAREDFIDLGYDHVTITFNGQRNLLHSFALHHPASKFGDPFLEDKFDNEALCQSLDDCYTNNGCKRNDSYIDILGHFHRSGLDSLNAICTVPSLFHDRYNNGAWHLRVYFDEVSNIKYMVFKPLDLKEKLVATTEIAYQKLVLK